LEELHSENADISNNLIDIPSDAEKDIIRLMAVVSLSDMVLTENSGVMHLADFMRKPCGSLVKGIFGNLITDQIVPLTGGSEHLGASVSAFVSQQLKRRNGGIDLKDADIKTTVTGASSSLKIPAGFDAANLNGMTFSITGLKKVKAESDLNAFIRD